jgi:hypothetical protein
MLQVQVDAINASTQATQEEITTVSSHINVREKQFAALLQCLADLQQSLEETIVLEDSEQQQDHATADHNSNLESAENQPDNENEDNNNNKNVEAMQIDNDDDDEDEEKDDDEALYDDL